MSKDQSDKGPEPVYHFSENFSTAYLGKTPDELSGTKNPSTDAKLISNFIDLLINPDKRDLRTEALETIRKTKATQFLVDLIASPQQAKHRRDLVMACWETGLDFSEHLIFFSDLAVNCEYPVALEAITVIDEMHDFSDIQKLKSAIEVLSSPSLSIEKQALVYETLERLVNSSR